MFRLPSFILPLAATLFAGCFVDGPTGAGAPRDAGITCTPVVTAIDPEPFTPLKWFLKSGPLIHTFRSDPCPAAPVDSAALQVTDENTQPVEHSTWFRRSVGPGTSALVDVTVPSVPGEFIDVQGGFHPFGGSFQQSFQMLHPHERPADFLITSHQCRTVHPLANGGRLCDGFVITGAGIQWDIPLGHRALSASFDGEAVWAVTTEEKVRRYVLDGDLLRQDPLEELTLPATAQWTGEGYFGFRDLLYVPDAQGNLIAYALESGIFVERARAFVGVGKVGLAPMHGGVLVGVGGFGGTEPVELCLRDAQTLAVRGVCFSGGRRTVNVVRDLIWISEARLVSVWRFDAGTQRFRVAARSFIPGDTARDIEQGLGIFRRAPLVLMPTSYAVSYRAIPALFDDRIVWKAYPTSAANHSRSDEYFLRWTNDGTLGWKVE